MFFDKIQTEILKNAVKRDLLIGKIGFNHRYGYVNDNVFVSDNHAYAVYVIPKDKFYLNIDNVFKNVKPINFQNLLKTEDVATTLEFTDTIKQTDKATVNVLMNGDEPIYLDSKLLNTFKSKYRTLVYKGTNGKSPVFIYDAQDERLLGLMLPVKIN